MVGCTRRLAKNKRSNRACVHFGSHNHPLSSGLNRGAQDDAKAAIEVQMLQNSNSNPSTILLRSARSLVQSMVVTMEGSSNPFDKESPKDVIKQLVPLSSPGIRTHIKNLRSSLGKGSLKFNILDLKRQSQYNFIHGSSFPGQGRVKVFGTDPHVPIEGKERTCTFHWTQSLQRHKRYLTFARNINPCIVGCVTNGKM